MIIIISCSDIDAVGIDEGDTCGLRIFQSPLDQINRIVHACILDWYAK